MTASMLKCIFFSLVLLFGVVLVWTDSGDDGDLVDDGQSTADTTSERYKRDNDVWKFPQWGEWYKDTISGKFYFRCGSTLRVEISNQHYSTWSISNDTISSCDCGTYTFNRNGEWYRIEHTNSSNECDNNPDRSSIPLGILSAKDQISLPHGGVWYKINGKYEYRLGTMRYKQLSNGCYKKSMNDYTYGGLWDWKRKTGDWRVVNERCCKANSCETRTIGDGKRKGHKQDLSKDLDLPDQPEAE